MPKSDSGPAPAPARRTDLRCLALGLSIGLPNFPRLSDIVAFRAHTTHGLQPEEAGEGAVHSGWISYGAHLAFTSAGIQPIYGLEVLAGSG